MINREQWLRGLKPGDCVKVVDESRNPPIIKGEVVTHISGNIGTARSGTFDPDTGNAMFIRRCRIEPTDAEVEVARLRAALEAVRYDLEMDDAASNAGRVKQITKTLAGAPS